MKIISATCPNCNHTFYYKSRFSWVLHTPFHWFGRRRIKCPACYHKAYIKGVRVTHWRNGSGSK